MMKRIILGVICVLGTVGLSTVAANAQASRTWVSGVGDDVNPCSRTAPCKTFAGAISKTAAGGEISVLDPGGFGAVTITKAITIDGDGTLAGILVGAGTSGVIVNAGVADRVVLRNLSINGAGTALNGVRFLAGGQLSIDKCSITGFTGNGIDVAKAANGELYVTDTYISLVNKGIALSTTAGFVTASVDNATVVNATNNGIDATSGNIFATVAHSTLVGNGGSGITTSVGAGLINVGWSTITNNASGVNAASSGSTIRISDNLIYNNTNDIAIGAGATVASDTSNKVGATPGVVPNAAITVR